MSLSRIKEMLKTLCYYNTVEITHTFSKYGQDFLKVNCEKNTEAIQLTFVECQTIKYYDDAEEAASVIEKLIND
ncbi:hypothetical protein RG959_21220 [Domibacillus sp. 8LH]|uniref:hypothetical protein n=1 Tax=Domibacillus sp. 8LH TaxID=3073900 RepID=UPI0031814C9E